MNSITSTISSLEFNQAVIRETIRGNLERDRWSTNDFPEIKDKWNRNPRWLVFETFDNQSIKNEVKYYFYSHMKNESLSRVTLWSNYAMILITLGNFYKIHFPKLNSIVDLPLEVFIDQLRNYMLSVGKTVTKKRYLTESNIRWQTNGTSESMGITAARSIYNYLFTLYDSQPELEKDRWDVRKLDVTFNLTSGAYFIDFTKIPSQFRPITKRYIKERLIDKGNISCFTAIQYVNTLRVLFNFIEKNHPYWNNLRNLNRTDILNFIEYLRKQPMGGNSAISGRPATEKYIYRTLCFVHVFLHFIQTIGYKEAPIKLVNTLINLSEDVPRQKRRKADAIHYIPDHIWEQVVENISSLSQETIPVILTLEATGFRISDVLQLKQNCLLEQDDGYWIQGLQRKIKYINHKVPISNEIANIIKAQIKYVNAMLVQENNPDNYLFPILKGKKRGLPPLNSTITRRLNNMAFKCGITDINREIYWFRSHGFRHRYGVNLVNNGMNIIHIQKLMAHACPEITLHYATIHDKTLRNAWEQARKSIVFGLDSDGSIISNNIELSATENGLELEWIRHNLDSIRLDHGYCIKAPKQQCDYLETTLDPPCIKNNCRSFHVDQTFIDYYQDQISKIKSDMDTYTKSERYRSIEIIKPKLEKYQSILTRLLKNQPILGMDTPTREYIDNERDAHDY
ncbi:recombinase XerD [Paenibacillus peoriae]|uniref:tyrosine-type recombinase/integrase n=1 Tax=Paenibacillus peoriae TaxID=59893 RepID=UPI000CEC1B31|nr:tyrosine-type recombinase/integrase [Paenibacillus peoriae]PPQ47525.1 recombinase XerD [Paenibacillus peoriae]